AQRMSGRILKGRSDAVLITRALKLLYKERPDIDYWFIVSGDRDLNALCKAIKDEDKHVYLVAGDRSLANELRDSPYLRDDVFLLEDLIPQARWTRPGLRADDTQIDKTIAPQAPARPQRRGGRTGRAPANAKQMLAPNMQSPLLAETVVHLGRVLRRIDTVTSRDTRRIPAVEAVLDPLSRADQPGGLARGRSARRLLLETLFNIAEERGAIATEQVERDARQITMCWLAEGHPLVVYARQPAASLVHLFNFVGSTRAKGERVDWVNAALFAELLSRVEGDNLESNIKRAIER